MRFNQTFMVVLVFGAFLLFPIKASAQSDIKSIIEKSSLLALPYGASTIKVGENEYMIVRGLFETEGTAWGGDIYTILLHDHEIWKRVRSKKDSLDSIIVNTIPHTYEDSVKSVRFLTDEKKGKLYLVEVVRIYDPNTLKTRVTITLFDIIKSSDFDVLFFHKVAEEETTTSYCNVDVALLKELDIALPEDGNDYLSCEK